MTKLTRVADFHAPAVPPKTDPVRFVDEVNITGVRQVFGGGSPILRRLVWLCLLMGMAALLVYQIYSRMAFYLTRPTAQTSSSVYYPYLTFPAVTICNQNFVRMDQTMLYTDIETSDAIPPERHTLLYELLSEYFRLINEPVIDVEYIRNGSETFLAPAFQNVSFYDIFNSGAHQKESMIKRCTFNGRECEPGWFEEVATDAGRCYRFNANTTGPLRTALYGKKGGLHLELNVEQYMYTRGQAPSAGVYVLIQDQAEIPNLVLNTALRIGAGFYTDIALRTINRTSHGREYGKCGETELRQFPADHPYTRSACEMDCLTRYIKEQCGCVHYFMPRGPSANKTEQCGLKDLVNCVYIQTDIFPTIANYTDYCSCMTPCHVKSYHASVSQVEFSSLATNLFVTGDKLDDVFVDYYAGMILRDWALILETDERLADDLHRIVYKFGTARQNLTVATGKLTQLSATLDLSLCDDSNLSELIFKVHLFMESLRPTLELELWGHLFKLPVIELSAGLAHNTLNNVPFNQTIYAAIRDNCSEIESTVRLIESEFLSSCAMSLQICDTNPSELICVARTHIAEYRQSLEVTCSEMAGAERLYEELNGHLRYAVGIWHKPWNTYILDEQFYRENYGIVDIFFQEMSVTEIKETAAYGPIAFFCDLGGSLGLCLGGSLLTLFECMDFLFLKLRCRCGSK